LDIEDCGLPPFEVMYRQGILTFAALVTAAICLPEAVAFSTTQPQLQAGLQAGLQTGLQTAPTTTSLLFASTSIEEDDTLTSSGLLRRDRYIATNRFAVRRNKEAKFEARWANRKSRLAVLPGFKYFHLMRRVTLNEDGTSSYEGGESKDGSNKGNYVSFTIWDSKSDFSAWRKGDAFKEAHGGTSISAFMSTMVSSALILKGPPRPAFYDGLLVQSTIPTALPDTTDEGWRTVEANGKDILDTECFIACNNFFVPGENGAEFEQRWVNRVSTLKENDGFVAFSMLRRDAKAKGHGVKEMDEMTEPTYTSTTIWKNRQAFEDWKTGAGFKKAHGSSKPGTPGQETKGEVKPTKPLWSRPPVPTFYEGTLVLSSPEGA
jgi:heme-degrading monooxygenase HmoA